MLHLWEGSGLLLLICKSGGETYEQGRFIRSKSGKKRQVCKRLGDWSSDTGVSIDVEVLEFRKGSIGFWDVSVKLVEAKVKEGKLG